MVVCCGGLATQKRRKSKLNAGFFSVSIEVYPELLDQQGSFRPKYYLCPLFFDT
jgi:hypothetical protein